MPKLIIICSDNPEDVRVLSNPEYRYSEVPEKKGEYFTLNTSLADNFRDESTGELDIPKSEKHGYFVLEKSGDMHLYLDLSNQSPKSSNHLVQVLNMAIQKDKDGWTVSSKSESGNKNLQLWKALLKIASDINKFPACMVSDPKKGVLMRYFGKTGKQKSAPLKNLFRAYAGKGVGANRFFDEKARYVLTKTNFEPPVEEQLPIIKESIFNRESSFNSIGSQSSADSSSRGAESRRSLLPSSNSDSSGGSSSGRTTPSPSPFPGGGAK